MSRRRRKRLFPTKYAAGYVKTPSMLDPEAWNAYQERAKTTSGPKYNREHIPQNSFNKPIIEGRVCLIYCDCGAGPFTFAEDYVIHTKHNPNIDHGITYVPDERKSHMDKDNIGVYIPHALIENEYEEWDAKLGKMVTKKDRLPKVEVNKKRFEVIQMERRTKINQLHSIKVGDYKLFFTTGHDRWFFVRIKDGKEQRSTDYISIEHAMLKLKMNKITWLERSP